MLEVRHRAAVDRLLAVSRAHRDARPLFPDADRITFPELECLRGLLSEQTLGNARHTAHSTGVGADRVLIHAGMLDEELYVRALAEALGVSFEMFEPQRRRACPLNDRELVDTAAVGLLPLIVENELKIVIAPQDLGARRFVELLTIHPHLARRFRLTTCERLHAFVRSHADAAVADYATSHLAKTWPTASAAPGIRHGFRPVAAAFGCALAAGLVMAPEAAIFGCGLALSAVFLAWAGLRLFACATTPFPIARPAGLRDCDLPIYSVLVPLYQETSSVKALVAALRALDYPREKLDIKLIAERDDGETIAAINRLQLPPDFQLIIAPPGKPRTKPKALNAALPFARGSFVVVYDAEDRPDRDQLRRALDTFLGHGDRLACVQASLTIDNSADNWLTAMFAAEYAGQFDVFLPALTRLAMPLPLGGSSNHFRTAALRAAGGWDPYNVTEDADLGLRLARFGYRSMAIQSSTYEEAPPQFGPWLRQRTRWFKGWMQTWLVHSRTPTRLLRELGPHRFTVVQLIVGGNVLASLVHPVMLTCLLGAMMVRGQVFPSTPAEILFAATIACGYLASALVSGVGLYRRRLLQHAWVLSLLPVYWLLLGAASWRALYQLVRDPYRWEKTQHGLARTSRIKAAATTPTVLQKPRGAAPIAAPSRA